MKFADLKIDERIINNLTNLGFVNATEVQEKTIPVAQQNLDAIIRSKTGSGKTFAFLVPIINKMLSTKNVGVETVILCPTRELVQQVKAECEKLTNNIDNINIVSVFGGESITKQIKLIKNNPRIIVGTTGRVLDLINRKVLKLNKVSTFVLDEADQMLDMGFILDIQNILRFIPSSCQKLMFSATFPENIKMLASTYLNNPTVIEIGIENKSLAEINQEFAIIKKQNKKQALIKILSERNYFLTLVFCNTKDMSKEVCAFLKKNKILAKSLNGDMTQFERNRVLSEFKTGKIAVLVATDVASRGLDIDDVDCIINYDIPKTTEPFLHRVGRTARAGKTGNAITLISNENEMEILKQIGLTTQTEFEKLDLEELNFYFYNSKKKDRNYNKNKQPDFNRQKLNKNKNFANKNYKKRKNRFD